MSRAENIIKSILDGTFTRVTAEGKFETVLVSTEFMPEHTKPSVGLGLAKETNSGNWTEEENETLIQMRELNIKFSVIAAHLWRTEKATRNQHRRLAVKRGLKFRHEPEAGVSAEPGQLRTKELTTQ